LHLVGQVPGAVFVLTGAGRSNDEGRENKKKQQIT